LIIDFKNSDLALWNQEMKRVVEPGDFEIMVGSSAEDICIKESFTVIE